MKLSAILVINAYRDRLKRLRQAFAAVDTPSIKINCKTWAYGGEIDFCDLLSAKSVKANLREMITQEINETVRALEAHGVVVDE